jgi:hypothetical protein
MPFAVAAGERVVVVKTDKGKEKRKARYEVDTGQRPACCPQYKVVVQ